MVNGSLASSYHSTSFDIESKDVHRLLLQATHPHYPPIHVQLKVESKIAFWRSWNRLFTKLNWLKVANKTNKRTNVNFMPKHRCYTFNVLLWGMVWCENSRFSVQIFLPAVALWQGNISVLEIFLSKLAPAKSLIYTLVHFVLLCCCL